MICCSFVVGQFDGELAIGMRIEFSIYFIGAPNKYLLQVIDTKQNRLSIKTSETFSEYNMKVIINYNGLTNKLTRGFHSGHNLYSSIYMLHDKSSYLLEIIYILSKSHTNINNKQINSSLDWPDARDLNKMRNQTKIWFGYSNKIINNDYDWSNNIDKFIIGCVDRLKFNNENIKLEMKGDNFYNYCNTKIIESICNQYGECTNDELGFYYIMSCKNLHRSSPSFKELLNDAITINTAKHCNIHRDLANKSMEIIQSNMTKGNQSKSIIVILIKIKQAINQGLVEITTRNDSLIAIYSNKFNQIILAIKYNKSINWSKYILYEISSKQIYILVIELTESNSKFRVSNRHFIKTLNLPQLGSVKLINANRNFGNNNCQQLTTKFDFDYDYIQFRQLDESHVPGWIIFLIMIISVTCNILVCIGWIISKIKKQKENIPRSTLNIYEQQIEVNNLAPPTYAAVIEERIEYIYDE